MSLNKARLSIDDKTARDKELYDHEPSSEIEHGFLSNSLHKILNYPSSNSVKINATSWLDGVRGVAALEVYIFHAMGLWAPLIPAWHADTHQTRILQLPILRTFFVSGGTAVSVFFALSGYVLTHKSLGWMRSGKRDKVYPAVASSVFRRGFRLYLPPIFVTFCEMVSTRFGFVPPLSFGFIPESKFLAQFLDWAKETSRFVNPLYNAQRALQGFITHPKYDAVMWTIALEFYGSLVCYTLLFLLNRIPGNSIRMTLVGIFAIISVYLGSWNLFCFSSGMLIADHNLSQKDSHSATILALPTPPKHQKLWLFLFAISFYVAGFPTLVYEEAKVKPMPGFETLRSLTPMSLYMEDHSRFLWSLSGVSILLSISQVPKLKEIFETDFYFRAIATHEKTVTNIGQRANALPLSDLRIDTNADDFIIRVMAKLNILIPEFILHRRMLVEWEVKGGKGPQLKVHSVGLDGTHVRFLRSVRLAYNRRLLKSEPYLFAFRGDLDLDVKLRLDLEFMGHYGEPHLELAFDHSGAVW
ncbi:O-acetyltransferase -1 [Hyphodiscus hymeniophilus]|uniref:O-acetyltransferase -1 n=1 Tax=Hyphodiscus hymeniophilus TaxID=353542 RepID=A0A9P6SMV4_9HELO|nr:O-acetyltransferase -1 [Hyphodiscus hymeniophilus]